MECSELDPDVHDVLQIASNAGRTKQGKSKATLSMIQQRLDLKHRDMLMLVEDLEASGFLERDEKSNLWMIQDCVCGSTPGMLDMGGGSEVGHARAYALARRERSRGSSTPPTGGLKESLSLTDQRSSPPDAAENDLPKRISGPRGKKRRVRRIPGPADLAKEFAMTMRRANRQRGVVFSGGVNEGALAKHFSQMLDDGVPVVVLQKMIEVFAASEGYLRPGTPPWRSFLNHREAIYAKARKALEAEQSRIVAPDPDWWLGSPAPQGETGKPRPEDDPSYWTGLPEGQGRSNRRRWDGE